MLEDLAVCIKYKDARCGNVIIRALVGCRKAVSKVFSHREKKPTVIVKAMRDFGAQVVDVSKFNFKGDLEEDEIQTTISDLVQRLESLKSSKVPARLIEVLRSLDKMYTEVPVASETPDLYRFEPAAMVQEIEKTIIYEVQKDIAAHYRKTNKPRRQTSIGLQAELKLTDKEKEVYQELCTQKEIELFNLTNAYKKLSYEYESLKELETKEQQKYYKMEEQLNALELALRNYKSKEVKMTEIIDTLKSDIKATANQSETYRKLYSQTRKIWKSSEERLAQVFAQFEIKAEELYQAQLNFGITAEKLEQIEKAYEAKTGEKFVFEEIPIEMIETKYGIKRSTEEIESLRKFIEETRASDQEIMAQIKQLKLNIPDHNGSFVREDYLREPILDFDSKTRSGSRSRIFSEKGTPKHANTSRSSRMDQAENVVYKNTKTERSDRFTNKLKPDCIRLNLHTDQSKSSRRSSQFLEEQKYNLDQTQPKLSSSSKPPHPVKPSSRLRQKQELLNEDLQARRENNLSPSEINCSIHKYGKSSPHDSDNSPLVRQAKNQSSNTIIIIRDLDESEVCKLLLNPKSLNESDVKSIYQWIKNSKRDFKESLTPENRAKYNSLCAIKKEFKAAKKWFNVNYISRGIQYNFNSPDTIYEDSDLLTPKSNLPATFGSKGLSSSFDSKLISSFRIKRIHDEILEGESMSVQNLISRVMIGHDSRCGEDCLHLKRAMAIKAKYRGRPYPVRLTNIEYYNRCI